MVVIIQRARGGRALWVNNGLAG